MDKYYYQFSVKVDKFKDEVESFLMDRFFNGIEESGDWLILRGNSPFYQLERELREYVEALQQLFNTPIRLEVSHEKRENRDWVESYRRSITGVEAGPFYIRPSWRPPKEGKIDLLIDPDLAFGTGHHETTRGVLQLLPKVVTPGSTFLDVGTGSGILGIAAAKLGAKVSGCDTDPLAVESAIRNSRLNGVKFEKLWLGSVDQAPGQYDVVAANIVADILKLLAPDLTRVTRRHLILSGIVDKYLEGVLKRYREFEIEEMIEENEWVTLLLKKVGDEKGE
jgi:ribosomal protein L11 methyltransferase